MGYEFTSDLSGLRDELINGLKALRKEVQKESEKVGQAIGDGYEDGYEDSVEVVRKSKEDLLRELRGIQSTFEQNLNKLPDILKKSFKNLDFTDLSRVSRRLKVELSEIQEIYGELSKIGININLDGWMNSMIQKSNQLSASLTQQSEAMRDVGIIAEESTDTFVKGANKSRTATEQQGKAVGTVTDRIKQQTKATEQLAAAQKKVQKLSESKLSKNDKNIIASAFAKNQTLDPVEYLSLQVSESSFKRLRPKVKAIMENTVTKLGLDNLDDIIKHYFNGEILNSPESLLFTLFQDYIDSLATARGGTQLNLDSLMENRSISSAFRDQFVRMLNGLSFNYSDLINFSDTYGLGNINLKVPEIQQATIQQEQLTDAAEKVKTFKQEIVELREAYTKGYSNNNDKSFFEERAEGLKKLKQALQEYVELTGTTEITTGSDINALKYGAAAPSKGVYTIEEQIEGIDNWIKEAERIASRIDMANSLKKKLQEKYPQFSQGEINKFGKNYLDGSSYQEVMAQVEAKAQAAIDAESKLSPAIEANTKKKQEQAEAAGEVTKQIEAQIKAEEKTKNSAFDGYKSPYSAEEMRQLLKGANLDDIISGLNISKANKAEITNKYNQLASMWADQGNVEESVLYAATQEFVDLIVKSSTRRIENATQDIKDGARKFLEYMQGKQFSYSDTDKAEFGDDWASASKIAWAKNKKVLSNKTGTPLTGSRYAEIVEVYNKLVGAAQEIDQKQNQLQQVLQMISNAKNLASTPLTKSIDLTAKDSAALYDKVSASMSIAANNAEQMRIAAEKAAEAEERKAAAAGEARKQLEGQENAEDNISDAADGIKKSLNVLSRDVDKALEQLRGALGDKKNLIDLGNIFSEGDLEAQIGELVKKVNGSNLEFDSVHLFGDTVSIKLSNKELGIHVTQLYQLKEATEDATKATLQFIETSSVTVNKKEQENYISSQQKAIDNAEKWLLDRQKNLNAQKRSYQNSSKKIAGSTSLLDVDATTLEKDADKTIDGLVAHIQKRIQENVGKEISEGVKNQIIQDLNALENEIKIQQLNQYTSTTMSASEVEAARKTLVNILDALASKARKNNVFDQISESYEHLRKRLTDNTVKDYIENNFIDAINQVRVIRSDLGKAIANEGENKKSQQDLQNLLSLQERLYEAKKKYAALEAKGEANTAVGQKASRQVEELQRQYDASYDLLKNEEQIEAVLEREIKLEQELNTAKVEQTTKQNEINNKNAVAEQEKQIKQYYQTVLNTVNKINSINSDILKFQKEDAGSGLYSGYIKQLQAAKEQLISQLQSTLQKIDASLSGGFIQGKEVSIPSVKFLDDNGAVSNFLNDTKTQAALTTEEIDKLVASLQKAQSIDVQAAAKVAEQFRSVQKTYQEIGSLSSLDTNSAGYKNVAMIFSSIMKYKQMLSSDPTQWTPEQSKYLQTLIDEFNKYGNVLVQVGQKEQQYFAGKQKYTTDTSMQTMAEDAKKAAEEVSTAQQKLTDAAQKFTEESGASGAIVTNFVQGADGIARLDFSVFDSGTNSLRKFRMEMGSVSEGTYITETTVNNFVSKTQQAAKQLQVVSDLISRLQLSGANMDNSSVVRLMELQRQLAAELSKGSNSDQDMLSRLTKNAKLSAAEVEKLYKQFVQLENLIGSGDAIGLGKINFSGDVTQQLKDSLAAWGAQNNFTNIKLTGLNEVTGKFKVTAEGADNTVRTFTGNLNKLGQSASMQQTNVQDLGTKWDRFKNSLSKTGKQLMTALVGYNVFFKAISEIRKGIGYVKDIDLAMTELRKVTDETEASYSRFLETASKTAGVIGSTVSDFTEATANFARLGYTLDESSKMAETAIIYKNVADGLDTVEESTESIISTMKAFGVESDNTMSIIDKFNEVGKYIAQVI